MIDNRPVYLNLLKITLPLTGIISFAHRISGFLLFLSMPFAVYLLELSLESRLSFSRVQYILSQPLMIAVQILLLWSMAHHFFAGLRFLLIDAEIGVDKAWSRVGAWLVILAEAVTVFVVIAMVML